MALKLVLIRKSTPFKIGGLTVVLQSVQKPVGHIAFILRKIVLSTITMLFTQTLVAQLNLTYDLKKPKAFENRKLKSEMTPDKKINPVKRMKENVVAHYNFYFNANNKLQDVIASAKQAHKDTFTQLIGFYNYSLDQTATQKQELDSIIHKANNGILLHDLRNDWVDDLYLLMGQAYFYQKKFDSAYDVFQYINYTFQPRTKEESGLEKTIGSNLNSSGNIYTVSTKETGFSAQPSARNDALLWIVRTLLEQGNEDEAKGLIETLYRDKHFPKRLKDGLAEQKAIWFLKNNQYDSTVHYLEASIDATNNSLERSRRYFLIAQLKSKIEVKEEADAFFNKAISITTDPIMEAYARIYQVALVSNEADLQKRTEEQVNLLLKMAKREKYLSYQSIIYDAAAEMELGRNNRKTAIELLLKSNESNSNDPNAKTNNNLKIANLAFAEKNYKLANTYYDSLGVVSPLVEEEIKLKKSISNELVALQTILEEEDSLQAIANMPPKERDDYLKALLKKLRKEQGALDEEEENSTTNLAASGRGQRNGLPDPNAGNIFNNNQPKGEWYFNNATLIAQGKTGFKSKWGSRQNADNWRRLVAINGTKMVSQRGQDGARRIVVQQEAAPVLSIESLAKNLPITKEQQLLSSAKRNEAYAKMGNVFQDKLGDWASAIFWYEKSLSEEADTELLANAYFNLSFCYAQLKNIAQSSFYKEKLIEEFPTSKNAQLISDPLAASKKKELTQASIDKTYAEIYDLFLAGKFETALNEKKKADQTYGENNWSAQLLYIESIYYIKNRSDEQAIITLNKIIERFPKSVLAEKAKSIADVVARRTEIETELNSMQITRVKEDSLAWIDDRPLPKNKESLAKKEEPTRLIAMPIKQKGKVDTTQFRAPVAEKKEERFTFSPTDPYAIMMILKDVDVVYVNEAKRALTRYHAERYSTNSLNIQNNNVGNTPYILISVFQNAADALSYFEKTAPIASREIFPWLQADKYKFIIVSPENLKKMMEDKSIEEYLRFLQRQLPGKF